MIFSSSIGFEDKTHTNNLVFSRSGFVLQQKMMEFWN